ncbi:MAG: DNA alkylation repair protein [Synoicihabitans sp.]
MATEESKSGESFKDWFNEERYHAIAEQLAEATPRFDRKLFLQLTREGLAGRELMARLQRTSFAANAALPGSFADKIAALRRVATEDANSFIGIWYSDFVGQFGLEEPEVSLPALRYFTRFGSAEFAIRGFILRDPRGTLEEMAKWSQDENEHVRRLASEGSRPRLPWGKQLGFLVEDPSPTQKILSNLRADPSLYVRKSVANHLNDISKDHPDYVVTLLKSWTQSDPHTTWIAKRALRTLIKNAHPPTLEFLGVGRAPKLDNIELKLGARRLNLGDALTLSLSIQSADTRDQNLLIDYVIHYVKASGATSKKVFKWKELTLPAAKTQKLEKRQVIRNFSTRRHYSGRHQVDVQINGQLVISDSFELMC